MKRIYALIITTTFGTNIAISQTAPQLGDASRFGILSGAAYGGFHLRQLPWHCLPDGGGDWRYGNRGTAGNGQLAIYPNPNGGSFTVKVQGTGSKELRIYDVAGRLIHQYSINNNQSAIEVSGLEAGMFYVQLLRDGEPSATKKMVITNWFMPLIVLFIALNLPAAQVGLLAQTGVSAKPGTNCVKITQVRIKSMQECVKMTYFCVKTTHSCVKMAQTCVKMAHTRVKTIRSRVKITRLRVKTTRGCVKSNRLCVPMTIGMMRARMMGEGSLTESRLQEGKWLLSNSPHSPCS